MKRKRQFTARVLALLLAAVLLGGTVPLGVTAADTIAVSPTALTTIVLADACEAFGHIDGGEGQLYVETKLGDPYFDRVRPGDRIDLKVRVEKAGTYRWCVVSGWAKDTANGTFRLFLDGEQITEPLANQVPGIDWRTWQDSTPGTVKLPAGEHTLSLVTDTAGPNLYALKLAPEGVELSVPEGTVPLCEADSNTPVQVYTDYAIQFCMTVPFDYVTVAAPSYNNNKGSFRLELFRWTESYSKTVGGQALATQDFIDFNDNATLKLKFGHNMDAGEYVLRLTNISEDANEQIGVWTSPTAPENVRNYQGGIEVANAARMNVHYFGSTDKPLAGISPAQGERAPVYEEIRESMKDLTRYGLPATSRYLTAELMPDTWVFTDALGRTSLSNAEVGDPRTDRTLALFYWIWHATFAGLRTPFNVQEFIDKQTAAGIPLEDYLYDFNYAGWPSATGAQYFWDQPIYGYYRSDDVWVQRRQAELLAAAGVDVVFSDNTNATLVWSDAYPSLYETWLRAQQDGVNTPKISYFMPFAAGDATKYQLNHFYTNIFHDGKYRSLWYYLDGKPMLAAYPSSLSDSVMDKQIAEFFTFRPGYASYFSKREFGTWGWLSTYPQAAHYSSSDRKNIEEMSVGVAQNANYETGELAAMSGGPIMGRSYTKDKSHLNEAGSTLWGYNFAEQFEFALEKDPKVIFVTGWNEWCASRYESWPDGGHSIVTNAFPDQFNNEYSRDLEPSRGALGDTYYYQFVNFVRRYKGVRTLPTPSQKASIDLTAGETQWSAVEPYYAASIGNTGDRNSDGYIGTHYSDYSGRNDIIGAQLARDGEYLYFHVECASDITPYTDPLWMNLYIDCDGQNAGWNTFDYVVNKSAASADTVVLERFTGDGYASEKVADCAYTVDGRYMTVRVRKSDIGLSGYDFTVNFAWTDNVHDADDTGTGDGRPVYHSFSGDILDFYTSGDAAPGGRFKFSYVSTAANAGVESDTATATETATGQDSQVPDSDTGVSESASAPSADSETASASAGGCKSGLAGGALLLVAAGIALATVMTAALPRRKKQ